MYCPNCKKEVGENDRFCQVCGTRTIQRPRCANCGEPLVILPGMWTGSKDAADWTGGGSRRTE